MIELRDHSQPCEHVAPGLVGAQEARLGFWVCLLTDCPGGREVTIDHDAGYNRAKTLGLQPWPFDIEDIELIVAAAIGDTG